MPPDLIAVNVRALDEQVTLAATDLASVSEGACALCAGPLVTREEAEAAERGVPLPPQWALYTRQGGRLVGMAHGACVERRGSDGAE